MSEDFDIDDRGATIINVIVRGAGFVLLAVGLLLSLLTIQEAYRLYQAPERIERFVEAIEKGSNIDKSLHKLRESAIAEANPDESAPLTEYGATALVPKQENVRVSYFLAWVIVLLLLLLIARIALAAVKTGGELVLYDMQMKKFARTLIRESGRR